MASVALAIERAASSNEVDKNLWWEPFSELLQELEECTDSSLDTVKRIESYPRDISEMGGILDNDLKEHHAWLLDMLSCFKNPSPSSRNAISSGKISIGSHSVKVNAEWATVAYEISENLDLDEVQSYVLVARTVKESMTVLDPLFKQEVVRTYYMERQCLLKYVRLLFTFQVSMDKQGSPNPYAEIISKTGKSLINEGIDKKIISNLEKQLSATRPRKWEQKAGVAWMEEAALEQSLLMDILFLLYYEPFCAWDAAQWKNMFTTFKDMVFEGPNVEEQDITSDARHYAQHIRNQAVIILIEALDFDKILLMVNDDIPFSQGNHAFSVEGVLDLDELLAGLDIDVAEEYALLFLGWATFICLVSYLTSLDGQTLGIEHTLYAQQAYKKGAYNVVLSILRSEPFKVQEIQVSGYKSVLKTFLAAHLAAYDAAMQADTELLSVLVDMLCEVYKGQESLAEELWDRESVIDGPIRSLLFSLRDRFPYEMLHLVRLLASQSEGAWPAECVYDFLYKLPVITCLHESSKHLITSEDMVRTSATIPVPNAPGLFLPLGSIGYILKRGEHGLLIRWQCEHSGILILLLQINQDMGSKLGGREVSAISKLFCNLLSSNKMLSHLFLDLNDSLVIQSAQVDGRLEQSLRIDFISLICSVLNNVGRMLGEEKTTANCVHILSVVAHCCPLQVASEFVGTSIVQRGSRSAKFRGMDTIDYWELKAVEKEHHLGKYTVTIAVLDFLTVLLRRGVQLDALSSLVLFAIQNILVNHTNWRYKQKHERWQISTKIFDMLSAIASLAVWDKHPLKQAVIDILLGDVIVHGVLLQVLTVDARGLEELCFRRDFGVREIECILQTVCSALNLLAVLFSTDRGQRKPSLLQQALFRQTTGTMSFITIIISLLGLFREKEIQISSAYLLVNLCHTANKSHPQLTSFAGYIVGDLSRIQLHFVLGRLLSERTSLTHPRLFCAISELLTTVVKYQPALVHMLLFPMEDISMNTFKKDQTEGNNRPNAIFRKPADDVLDSIWKIFQMASEYIKSSPRILLEVLRLLASIWQNGAEYLAIIVHLRSKPGFWKLVKTCVLIVPETNIDAKPEDSNSREQLDIDGTTIMQQAHKYACQAFALQIMANDIFLHRFILTLDVNSTWSKDYGPLQILQECNEKSEIRKIFCSNVNAFYKTSHVHCSKAEARAFVIGLMANIMSHHVRGLDPSFIKQIQQLSSQLLSHPSFEELFGQYSTRGYSYGEHLQLMLVSDLYYHLQGEMQGGRHMPGGSFQSIAKFLADMNLDSILVPSSRTITKEPQTLLTSCLYDIPALEAALGLDWWQQNDSQILTSHAAALILQRLQNANAMAFLEQCHLSSLHASVSLYVVSAFSREWMGQDALPLGDVWTHANLQQHIEGLCDVLENCLYVKASCTSEFYASKYMELLSRFLLSMISKFCRSKSSVVEEKEILRTCVRTVTVAFAGLKSVFDWAKLPIDIKKGLVKTFLSVISLSLEYIHSLNHEEPLLLEGSVNFRVGDSFADVAVLGLKYLPILCTAARKEDFTVYSIATLDILIRAFLASSTWLPILQSHFPVKSILSRFGACEDFHYAGTILRLFLSMSHLKAGGEMLAANGFFSHLLMFCQKLRESISGTNGEFGGCFDVARSNGKQESLWKLGVAIVTAMLRSAGEGGEWNPVIEGAMLYFRSEAQTMLSFVKAPDIWIDSSGIKKTKLHHPRTSICALQCTHFVVTFLHELIINQTHSFSSLYSSFQDFREMGVHFLAYIARHGLDRPPMVATNSVCLLCPPSSKEEAMELDTPSVIRSNHGWFGLCARGSRMGGTTVPTSECRLQRNTLVTTSESNIISIEASMYSDKVALEVYKIVATLLHFFCSQAGQAISRLEDSCATNNFPELPALEILQAIQDQVIPVVTDVCRNGRPKAFAEKTCSLLLNVLEKALYLEACISRLCGSTGMPIRSDDFPKECRELIIVAEKYSPFQSFGTSLRHILSVAYPGMGAL